MDQRAISYLLALLASKSKAIDSTFLNNLVYRTARIKSLPQLVALVEGIFQSDVWSYIDLREVYQMAEAIMYWKLEISEPSIPVSSFYDVWNACFAKCDSWTMPKLSILGGILSTKGKFIGIQSNAFVDDTGNVISYYNQWRVSYFIPIMNHFLSLPHADCSTLVLMYATISEEEDSFKDLVGNWDMVTFYLSAFLSAYMLHSGQNDNFLAGNMNRLAQTLQISIARSSRKVVSAFLSRLCRDCYDLSIVESRGVLEKDYSTVHYSNILFTITLTLRGMLETSTPLPFSSYYQSLMCLFYINFITHDIGSSGLDSYETVYEITSIATATDNNYKIYQEILNTMNGNIWHSTEGTTNKVNTSRLFFMFSYMGTTLNELDNLDPHQISEIILPLKRRYIDSPNEELRESVHLFVLSLFMNNKCTALIEWQSKNFLNYISISVDQFLRGNIKGNQLVIIYQKMASRVPYLRLLSKHVLRDSLHYTYLRTINCKGSELQQKKTLMKCIIYQLPYLTEPYLITWLDTCQDLLAKNNFTAIQRSDVLCTMWDTISSCKSDIALKWWYANMVPLNALL
ncbi:hypothetical protein HG535_0C03030 [Zygotorulaspora mrakii]|uniref:Uncharacterized protein n=1 Tax=Zygotorulaspora mrakii TaxID=42260 RepID=A0A7H9B004_ZYGMR|nr:uncharacterized protein HG535_0C03030 [Zygotorulaspora mrakii]QLG71951.1 hypothetical protein HG535_0C03030 [Zygotorulaspora mrakii]